MALSDPTGAATSRFVAKSGRIFGEIPGFPPGSHFPNRKALHAAGIHGQTQAGISYGSEEGADAIVISGGYEDDDDHGDHLIYTGQGGQENGRQVADQTLTRGNLGLAKSHDEGLPIRVTRGAGARTRYSPRQGYRYDGLFMVERYWHDVGRSGYRVYQYSLVQISGAFPQPEESSSTLLVEPRRVPTTTHRISRNWAISHRVKELHGYRCQICQVQLATPGGFYAEGAHIRPLGRPHNGSDSIGNILCLCPNDHVLFDVGAIYIDHDLSLKRSATGQLMGRLATLPSHRIDHTSVRYHREHIANV